MKVAGNLAFYFFYTLEYIYKNKEKKVREKNSKSEF